MAPHFLRAWRAYKGLQTCTFIPFTNNCTQTQKHMHTPCHIEQVRKRQMCITLTSGTAGEKETNMHHTRVRNGDLICIPFMSGTASEKQINVHHTLLCKAGKKQTNMHHTHVGYSR